MSAPRLRRGCEVRNAHGANFKFLRYAAEGSREGPVEVAVVRDAHGQESAIPVELFASSFTVRA